MCEQQLKPISGKRNLMQTRFAVDQGQPDVAKNWDNRVREVVILQLAKERNQLDPFCINFFITTQKKDLDKLLRP